MTSKDNPSTGPFIIALEGEYITSQFHKIFMPWYAACSTYKFKYGQLHIKNAIQWYEVNVVCSV
jgi:hypothetical protein